MNSILKELEKSQKYLDLIKSIENKKSPIDISGLTDVAEVALLTAINEHTKRPIMFITYNEVQAQKLIDDFKFFTDKVHFFPKKDIVTYDYVAESKDLPYERIEVLNKINKEQNIIIVTSIEAVKQKIILRKIFIKIC